MGPCASGADPSAGVSESCLAHARGPRQSERSPTTTQRSWSSSATARRSPETSRTWSSDSRSGDGTRRIGPVDGLSAAIRRSRSSRSAERPSHAGGASLIGSRYRSPPSVRWKHSHPSRSGSWTEFSDAGGCTFQTFQSHPDRSEYLRSAMRPVIERARSGGVADVASLSMSPECLLSRVASHVPPRASCRRPWCAREARR